MPTDSYNNRYVYPEATLVLSSQNRRSRNWTNTVGYRDYARRDDLPINSYTDYRLSGSCDLITKIKRNNSTKVVSIAGRTGWPNNDSSLGGFMWMINPVFAMRTDADMQNEALLKTLAKVSDAKTNLAVMFAEKAKTSSLIMDSANRIYRAMSALRRGRFTETARILNITPTKVHKTWLEYKYGWMPLLMDVKNSAEFFAQQHCSRPLRFSCSSLIQQVKSPTLTQPGFNWMGFQSNLETITYNTEQTKVCRVKLWCEINNPVRSQLQQLGLTNPALVAWELVPYSFVFDWFIHVGDYLQGLTALHGVTVRKAMVSHASSCTGGSTETFPGYQGVYDYYFPWVCRRKVNTRNYVRSPLTVDESSLYPPVDFSLPSWQKMVTGLALLRSNSRSFGSIRV